jgi:hypothetical protein
MRMAGTKCLHCCCQQVRCQARGLKTSVLLHELRGAACRRSAIMGLYAGLGTAVAASAVIGACYLLRWLLLSCTAKSLSCKAAACACRTTCNFLLGCTTTILTTSAPTTLLKKK